MKPKNKSWT